MREHLDKSTSPRKSNSGTAFTLVELLVVIGIIAVLIGLMMPVLAKSRAAANRAVCLSNIRQLGIGVLMYCNDNKGWFPTCAAAADGLTFIQYPDDWVHWQANRKLDDSAIAKYVTRGQTLKSLLRCPADTFEGRKTHPGILAGQGSYLYSYSANSAMGRNVKPYGVWRVGGRRINQWRATSKKILLTEAWEKFAGAAWSYSVPLTQRHGTGIFHGNVPGDPELVFGAKTGVRVSAVFVDGHAESIDQDFAFNRIHEDPKAE